MKSALLILALLYDRFIGERPSPLHPVRAMGSTIGYLWKRRPNQSSVGLFLYGGFILLSGIILALTAGYAPRLLPPLLEIPLTIFLLKSTFSFRMLLNVGRDIEAVLARGDLKEARRLTGWHLVSRDTRDLTEEEIASCVIESVAENLTDSLTTPLVCYALGGLPLAMAARFINTGDAMIGYRDEEHEWGGKLTARIDDILHLIPARLTALMLCLSAGVLGFGCRGTLQVMVREHGKTSSPNAGWTMSALAGALKITLAKVGQYSLEGGLEKQTFRKIEDALKICRLAGFLITALILITIILTTKEFLWISF